MRSKLQPSLSRLEEAHAGLLSRLHLAPHEPAQRASRRVKERPTLTEANTNTFFSKELRVGACASSSLPIRAHADVSDAALFVAADRVGRMLRDLPLSVLQRLQRRGAAVHIVGRRQQVSDLPEHRHLRGKRGLYSAEAFEDPRRIERYGVWAERCLDINRGWRLPLLSAEMLTIDERTRGLGGLQASCGEENLVSHDADPRYGGRDTLTHEFAHVIMDYGLGQGARAAITEAFETSTSVHGLWRRPDGSRAYAGTCAEEYFAELSMWHYGSHGEYVDTQRRLPSPGPHGLQSYDPTGFALVGALYSGTHPSLTSGDDAEPHRLLPHTTISSDEPEVELAAPTSNETKPEAPCLLEISNAGPHTVSIGWKDSNGTVHSYGSLDPGGCKMQRTFCGHEWVVEDLEEATAIPQLYRATRHPHQLIQAHEDLEAVRQRRACVS